jgi:hypothetical protein
MKYAWEEEVSKVLPIVKPDVLNDNKIRKTTTFQTPASA